MNPVKREITNQEPARAGHSKWIEDLSVEGWSDYLAMRRRLCNLITTLFTLGVVFAGVLIVLHGIGLLMLPTTVLTTLVIAMFGAVPRMLSKIIKSTFYQE